MLLCYVFVPGCFVCEVLASGDIYENEIDRNNRTIRHFDSLCEIIAPASMLASDCRGQADRGGQSYCAALRNYHR